MTRTINPGSRVKMPWPTVLSRTDAKSLSYLQRKGLAAPFDSNMRIRTRRKRAPTQLPPEGNVPRVEVER